MIDKPDKKVKNGMRMRKGFTLIELLVSVAVMAVLTGGVMSLMGQGSRRYARDGRRQTDLQTISTALTMTRNDNGVYPTCAGNAVVCDVSTLNAALVTPGYLGAIPADPIGGGRTYRYVPMTNGGGACDNAGNRCARFRICASSERDTTTNNNAQCGNTACGTANCVFVVTNQ